MQNQDMKGIQLSRKTILFAVHQISEIYADGIEMVIASLAYPIVNLYFFTTF
jgi:hypothetical protein